MTSLPRQPSVPDHIREAADDESPIVQITTRFVGGDVGFAGLEHDLIDMGHGGEPDLVASTVMDAINRFALHYNEGEDFVLGWLYRDSENDESPSWDGLTVEVRDDVQRKYANRNWPDNPATIHERYDAYDH